VPLLVRFRVPGRVLSVFFLPFTDLAAGPGSRSFVYLAGRSLSARWQARQFPREARLSGRRPEALGRGQREA